MMRQHCVTALNPLQFGPFRIPHHANLIFSLEVGPPVDISTGSDSLKLIRKIRKGRASDVLHTCPVFFRQFCQISQRLKIFLISRSSKNWTGLHEYQKLDIMSQAFLLVSTS